MAGQADLLEKVRTLESLIATGEASSTCDSVTEQGISASSCCLCLTWPGSVPVVEVDRHA